MRPSKTQISLQDTSFFVIQNAPSEDSDQPAHSRSAQADRNLRWAHMSEGTFPDVAAPKYFNHSQYTGTISHPCHALKDILESYRCAFSLFTVSWETVISEITEARAATIRKVFPQ